MTKIYDIEILKEDYVKQMKNRRCILSDLAKLQGCTVDDKGYGFYYVDGINKNEKKGSKPLCVHSDGNIGSSPNTGKLGVRIAFHFNDIAGFDVENFKDLKLEYPLSAICGPAYKTIDTLVNNNSNLVIKTGRSYDIYGKLYDELETFGMRYIKFTLKVGNVTLSDGTKVTLNDPVYLMVEPIPLNIDIEEKIIYSDIIVCMGTWGENTNFHDSYLRKTLKDYLLPSITDSLEHKNISSLAANECKKINNKYNFNFKNLSEEEIMEICIENRIAVFLHGQTGVGKTERVLSLDKDLELVDFGCTTQDGFVGIIAKDFNSKELFTYEPYWYKNLSKKCAEDKEHLHILFLEELTNARSDTQKVAFEVTLNRTLTNSGFRLNLPENASVVAAGNEANESRSVSNLSEPLFSRFAHVYINTDSEEWLKWALNRKKENKQLIYKESSNYGIHPAIIDYIRIKGNDVLRTPYNGTTPNADPRKWALASKALYASNNPNVLRAFVGEEITNDFINFCRMNIISVEDVLMDKVSIEDFSSDASLKWHSTLLLTSVDEENVDKIRDFVKQFGNEFLALFDYEWSKDNDERIMYLYEKNNSYTKRLK